MSIPEIKPTPVQVALVNMPIVSTQSPSLGLSLLKSELHQHQIRSEIHYLNIDYAERVGLKILSELETLPTAQLVGDWIFSENLWGADDERDNEYIEQVIKDNANEHPHHDNRCASDELIDGIWHCRAAVDGYIEHCLTKVDWAKYHVVGFTSMFQQHIASLAFAKRLKETHPHLVIVFGGANCADDMGRALLENFSFVDAVSLGMAEGVFTNFVSAILNGETPASTKDFIIRGTIPSLPLGSPAENLQEIPFPDFDDFFRQRVDESILADEPLSMMVETSRGCWWGQKHHCTFCGLNNAMLNYRFKSAERAMSEFKYLTDRYGHYTKTIAVVDNIIPMDYMRTFLPLLRDCELELDIFYETKANLKKEHLKLYRDAGLNIVQPGIESFSNRLLKMMKKGITGLQNVQFLKWCREFGVTPIWNYLVGFPGELADDHYQQLQWFPLLAHLSPPDVSWIRIDRFSPYHSEPDKYGIEQLKPFSAFQYLYPSLTEDDRYRVAYYFTAKYAAADEMFGYSNEVNQAISSWQEHFEFSSLFYFDDGEKLTIIDDRDYAKQATYHYNDMSRWLYLQCDKIRVYDSLVNEALANFPDITKTNIDETLQDFVSCGLMLKDEGKFLSLAVSIEHEYFPPQHTWDKVSSVLT